MTYLLCFFFLLFSFRLSAEEDSRGVRMGIFLDTETSGLDAKQQHLIEIAFKVVDMSNGKLLHAYDSVISISEEEWKQRSSEALEVNGFYWGLISMGLDRSIVKKQIEKIFQNLSIRKDNACYICQNPSFDRAFFAQLFSEEEQYQHAWPYHWLDFSSMHWALQAKEYVKDSNASWKPIGFSKDAIAKEHGLEVEQKPHRAMQGVDHLIQLYRAIVGFKPS